MSLMPEFKPQGPLVQATVPTFHKALKGSLGSDGLRLDLSSVQEVDSSALALLIDVRRELEARGAPFEVVHVPESMRTLARLYNVEFIVDNVSR
jgi:phospholipid transport system transporter-binding protein